MCNLHWCYTFCTGVTLFALVLHLNCTALGQSESSNFFMCIITTCYSKMSTCMPLDSYPILESSVDLDIGTSWNFYCSTASILHVTTAMVINWITNATAVLVWILWINPGQFYQSATEVLCIGIKHGRLKTKNLHSRNWLCLKEIHVHACENLTCKLIIIWLEIAT